MTQYPVSAGYYAATRRSIQYPPSIRAAHGAVSSISLVRLVSDFSGAPLRGAVSSIKLSRAASRPSIQYPQVSAPLRGAVSSIQYPAPGANGSYSSILTLCREPRERGATYYSGKSSHLISSASRFAATNVWTRFNHIRFELNTCSFGI